MSVHLNEEPNHALALDPSASLLRPVFSGVPGLAHGEVGDVEIPAGSDDPITRIYPQESAQIAGAVPRRQAEYRAARACARLALTEIGIAPAPILKGDMGAPQWPRGVVGSMTHCDGFRGAVVARKMLVRSVGLDAEPHAPLPDRTLEPVSLPSERAVIAERTAADPDVAWDRLLFCAKEATYKVWFPVTGRWLGFEDAEITFSSDVIEAPTSPDTLGRPAPTAAVTRTGGFTSRIMIDPRAADGGNPVVEFTGRWRIANGIIVAGSVLR